MWEHSLASTKQKANLASTKQKATASPAQNKRPQHSQQPFWPPTAAILATNSSHFGHQQQPFLATAISQPYIYQIPDFCGSTGSCGSMGPHCFFYVFLLESAMVQKAWSRSMVQKAWSRNGPEVWSRKHGPEVWSRIAKNLKKKKKKKIYDLVRTSTSTSTSTFCGSNWKLLFMKIYNF
jgi:hypothetical protein